LFLTIYSGIHLIYTYPVKTVEESTINYTLLWRSLYRVGDAANKNICLNFI
jgi:hypothetical protein